MFICKKSKIRKILKKKKIFQIYKTVEFMSKIDCNCLKTIYDKKIKNQKM